MNYNVGKNNPMFGRKHSEETKRKIAIAKLGDKHPLWKGNDVQYRALHSYMQRHMLKPKMCLECHEVKELELANITGVYNRSFTNWAYLCKSCHNIIDNRILNLKDSWKNLQRDQSGKFVKVITN